MPSIETAAPQLLVADLDASLAFYATRLGFTTDFVYEAFYASVSRDGVPNELVGRGAPILEPLGERPWGMVDFYVEDPDGYILCFAERAAAGGD